jgi:cellulose synthase/poly-beta-1,6-N-acetylglucosamine synthase-like glycosyltransferase
MKVPYRLHWIAAAAALAILASGLFAVAAGGGTRRTFSLGVYLLVNAIVFMDAIDLVLRVLYRRKMMAGFKAATSVPIDVGTFTPYQIELHVKPYALVVSLYNAEAVLDDFLETVEPFRDRLFIIDDCSTDQTYLRLRRAGIQCIRGDVNRKKPAAIRNLVQTLPREIETLVVLDPDARILPDGDATPRAHLERILFEFQRSGAAALCPRLMVREDGWLARLQELEYALAFSVGRRSLADRTVTSGIAIYRRDAFEAAMEQHSLSVYAEDLRNALLMLGKGERIYYDGRLVVETEGKRKLHNWFSQRVGWFYGLIKVYTETFPDVLRCARRSPFYAYHYLVYIGVFTLLFHPLKIVALGLATASTLNAFDSLLALNLIPDVTATDPFYFLVSYLKYTVLVFAVTSIAVPRHERARLFAAAPIFYFYALLHIVPITIGYLNWVTLGLFGHRVYRDHFQDEESLRKELNAV